MHVDIHTTQIYACISNKDLQNKINLAFGKQKTSEKTREINTVTNPMQLLKVSFVNGEISQEEFKEKIVYNKTLWLIKIILENHQTKEQGKGMPLGNLTSQFFANIYLNKLDQYVKHKLKIKQYIRYVDDFVILHESSEMLKFYQHEINNYLKNNLSLELHPDKSKIIPLRRGITFLGMRIFYYHKLLKKTNIDKFQRKLSEYCDKYDKKKADYDEIYDLIDGWHTLKMLMHITYKQKY